MLINITYIRYVILHKRKEERKKASHGHEKLSQSQASYVRWNA
ncbi:hypothetical protein PB1_08582 [Bacillus methanolicus PB1]|uniref:Uncharacterized protein n=1 Tax=Bacillus methanolicus PB1 TaxID=997296 RepID=I3E1N1_BACMT|nr:hypothetical protein PB1_08582 [Bacillus methanolicus PB1]